MRQRFLLRYGGMPRSNELLFIPALKVPEELQDAVKYRFKKITPIPEISHIQTLCRLLECLIVPQNIPSNDPPKVLTNLNLNSYWEYYLDYDLD